MRNYWRMLALGMLVALGLPGAAWAQQQDLEVTIGVVSANGGPDDVTGEIHLPDVAAMQGKESSEFGLGIANMAREARGELGKGFGQAVSAAAHERAQSRGASQGHGRP